MSETHGSGNHGSQPSHSQHGAHAPAGVRPAVGHTPHAPSSAQLAKVAGIPANMKAGDVDLDPISLVDEEPPLGAASQPQVSKIRAFSVAAGHAQHAEFKRKPNVTGNGICRVRTFHGRLSDEGMAFMDDKINEWLDAHPEIEVKQVTTSIGLYDGKIKEPALVLNVWY